MHSLVGDSSNKYIGKLMQPIMGDHNQGNFFINLWRNSFKKPFTYTWILCNFLTGDG